MKNTRFMEVLFSAVENKDEELANQVAKDIEDAKANGSVDTDEVKYENMGDGKVSVTDKGNGEVTIVEKASDESDTYDMYPAEQDQQIEGYLHPEGDGVTPGQQVGAPDEKVEDHMENGVIAPNMPCGGLNPEAGCEKSVEVTAQEGPQSEEKEFSVSTDNSVVLRIFSDQEYCERLFSEVIESEETAKVGNLKVEKIPEEEEANSIVVTDEKTGDRAKVTLDGEEMMVTELDSKNFSEEEQYNPLFVVGVDPINHIIVDAPEYDEASAQELIQSLTEKGVEGCQIFEDPTEAREYAISLLEGLGVQHEEDIEEPVQAEFSDHTIYLTEFNAPEHSEFMCRLFSESINGIGDIQSAVEDAIENGDEIETENEIITPIDSKTAVVEDKDSDEFTKVSLEGPEMELEKINENQAQELTDHIAVSEDEEDEDEEEKKFSEIERYFSDTDDIYCDEEETKFFSENEELTNYMIRLYSEESDSAEIEKAIENGEQIENESEVITPIDSNTAVVEDKENGEFTKATIDNDNIEVHPISEEEADKLTEDLAVEDTDEDEDKEDEEEKKFSEITERLFSDYDGEIYCDEEATKFFSENEEFTSYMERLFSGDCDCEDVEKAIENGEQIETDKEIITPIDSKSAVVEDKDNGEFTKATMTDDDVEVHPLTEEEADNLTNGLAVESDKKFSEDPILDKFFSDVVGMGNAAPVTPATPVPAGSVDPNTPVIPVADPNAAAPVDPAMDGAPVADGSMGAPTVEAIEDKALAAVQSIRAVADEAANQIMEAKAAPAPVGEEDLKEAQFSEKMNDQNDTLVSWLNGTKFNK